MRTLLLGLFLACSVPAQERKNEADYSVPDCESMEGLHARIEVETPMGTFPDCLVLEHVSRLITQKGVQEVTTREAVAWEYDWGSNSYEALGQAIHYASLSDALPGVAVILRDDENATADCRGVERLLSSVSYLKARGVNVQVRFLGPGLPGCSAVGHWVP